ncbi:hypothetical protein ACIP1U_32405 [Cupriavidus sp. NPDC089707]|uniref:hypothetical protein n=1 Tax=Cupriavidus sp. NPDC089707 TaxID=3363963 RepID=UPI0038214999
MKTFSENDPVFSGLRNDPLVSRSALANFVVQANSNAVLNSYLSKAGSDLVVRIKNNDELSKSRDGAFFNPEPDRNGKLVVALNPDWFIGPNAKFPTTSILTVSHELDHYTRVADLQKSMEILNDVSRSPVDRLSGYIALRMQTEVMGARAEFQALRAAYGIAPDAPIPKRYQMLLTASDRQLLQVEAAGYEQGLRSGALDAYFAENGAGVLSRNTTYWERYTNGIAEQIGVSPDAVAKLRSDLAYKLADPDAAIDWSVQNLSSGLEQISRTYANGETVIDNYDAVGCVGREVIKNGVVIERSTTGVDSDGVRVTTTVDGNGRLLSTSSEQIFDDGSTRTRIEYPDGRIVLATTDADGTVSSQVVQEVGAAAGPAPESVLGSIQSMLSLVQAIESGDTKAIVAASAAMLANLDRAGGGTLLPDGVGVGLNALAAGINLFNAIQDGDGLRIAASSLNLGSQAATIYANMLKDQGIAAYEAGATTAGNSLMESAGTMGQVAGGLALVASIVSLVMAIEDGNGYQIASAALSTAAAGFAVAGYTSYCPPLAFAAVAVAMIGAAFTDDDIPTLEGEATAVWNPDGSIHVLTTVDTEQGGGTPTRMLQSLVDELQKSLAAQMDANGNPVYAIIPQRLPTIGYAYDPDSYLGNAASFDGAPGHLYLKWIDENGQEQTRYFDGVGNRGQAGQATLMQEFQVHAFEAVAFHFAL